MKGSQRPAGSSAASPAAIGSLAERFEAASMRFGKTMATTVGARVCSGLTMPQYHILRMAASDDGLRASDLADFMSIQPSAVTAMVDRLVAKGLAERVRDETDRRIVHVCATEAGLAELARARASLRAWFREVFSGLEQGEAEEFVRVFEKIESLASEAAQGEE